MFYHLIGGTPAQSAQNLRAWMDGIAIRVVQGGDPLVQDFEDNREPGVYHHMRQDEHMHFFQSLLGQSAVAEDCRKAGVWAGKLYSIEGSGRGTLIILVTPCAFFK